MTRLTRFRAAPTPRTAAVGAVRWPATARTPDTFDERLFVADTWNGKELPRRAPLHIPLGETVHYRLYDRATGALLSFNSTNSFASLAEDIAQTQREHPDARIIAVRYDGPAYA